MATSVLKLDFIELDLILIWKKQWIVLPGNTLWIDYLLILSFLFYHIWETKYFLSYSFLSYFEILKKPYHILFIIFFNFLNSLIIFFIIFWFFKYDKKWIYIIFSVFSKYDINMIKKKKPMPPTLFKDHKIFIFM